MSNSLVVNRAETKSNRQLERSLALSRLVALREAKEGLRVHDVEAKRESLLEFIKFTMPSFEPAEHHRLICSKLEAVERGEIDRLVVAVPRRHGKTEIASRRFPAWYLGRHPDRQIICASYGGGLAKDLGYDVRGIINSPSYRALFETRLAPDKMAADRWNTRHGGVYVATSVSGQTIGRGAHILVIDDPHKDRDSADSAADRHQVMRWYRAAAYPALMPGGAVVVIQTRWRDDDLTGELLADAENGGDQWEVINLPAVAGENDELGRKPGEALWPSWYDLKALDRIRHTAGPREWQAQYQQDPQPEEGDYFKAEWVKYWPGYDENKPRFGAPQHLHIYGTSDYAVTDDDGDFTVHGIFGIDPDDNIYVIDWWRAQTASDVWVEALIDLMERWRPLAWGEEKDQITRSLGPFINKRMRERKVYCWRRQYPGHRDKATKARSFQARMAMGKVYFPKEAPWVSDLVHEMLRFPTGVNDDQVDVLSLLGRMLDRLVPGRVPPKPKDLEIRPPTLDELIKMQPKLNDGLGQRI